MRALWTNRGSLGWRFRDRITIHSPASHLKRSPRSIFIQCSEPLLIGDALFPLERSPRAYPAALSPLDPLIDRMLNGGGVLISSCPYACWSYVEKHCSIECCRVVARMATATSSGDEAAFSGAGAVESSLSASHSKTKWVRRSGGGRRAVVHMNILCRGWEGKG